MTLYLFKAINEKGKPISGEIEADSSQTALELLSRQGHIPESVKKKTSRQSGIQFFAQRISATDLILYTKQFKTLLTAGVSILQIFQILEAQTENKSLKSVSAQIIADVKQGTSLFEAFSVHKSAFSHLYCSMIKAGEESGSLPLVLERLIYIIDHEEKVRNDIKSAVRYPLIVLIFLGVAFMILLTFVVPKFVGIFEAASIELPLPTKICMMLYSFLNQYWISMNIFLVIFVIGIIWYIKTDQGRLLKDISLMQIPVIGPLFIKSSMSRFSSIFAILQSSGITILESMRILTDTINNAAISREVEKIRGLLEEGRGISRPLGQARYFTPMVINMVAIGEESGNLDVMLQEIATHYDAEVEYATKGLADAIGPFLMVGLAAVVGFFALAIFLPMWDLTKMV
ncbi:type II secretion system F family protein [Desulfobacula toluolica]|uniref:GspF: predicted general secretion pathway protein F n=1 Tax=Desulfobacula toluolica (strain DSM 7467 / Tol2) TaxID=651182 RepID=K0N447_DESTT|nr:type II secretion system F family protein [Desulfobacula toluolica]CCK78874.1 GspF: predicted general secretion pathway protein F [Desulfobacula toluolica Tol2]